MASEKKEPVVDEKVAEEAAKTAAMNEENSKLGRKVSTMGSQIAQLSQMMNQMATSQNQFMETMKAQQESSPPEDDSGDDYYGSKKDMDQAAQSIYHKMEQEKQRKQQDYTNGYLTSLDGFSQTEDPSMYSQIKQELSKPNSQFNVRHSDSPQADAARNFFQAKAHVLSERLKNPTASGINSVLKGNPPANALGVGGNSMNDTGNPKEAALDKEASRFVELMKERDPEYTDEKVQKALSGEDRVGAARGSGV